MREYFTYGSARGAPGNRRSYRDIMAKTKGNASAAPSLPSSLPSSLQAKKRVRRGQAC